MKVLFHGLLCSFSAAFLATRDMCLIIGNSAYFTSQANSEQLIDKSEGTKPSALSVGFLYSLEVKSGKNWATKTRIDLRQISAPNLIWSDLYLQPFKFTSGGKCQ